MSAPESQGRLRLFIAITLPEPVKDAIQRVQGALRGGVQEGGILRPRREQLHLTLIFLGTVQAGDLGRLMEAAADACRRFPRMSLRSEKIGFFPDTRRPRVVWVSVHDPLDLLPKLQQALQAAVRQFSGQEAEPEFIGHVTLGRVKSCSRAEAGILARLAASLVEHVFGDWTADHAELVRSELSSAGSNYSCLARLPFEGA